jgi:transaldolase/glucose-6-phosphate isomerase
VLEQALADWDRAEGTARLWRRDASLWTHTDEADWMGWLDIVDRQLAELQPLLDLQQEVKTAGFTDVLLLGMGGSSLCPEVTAVTFGAQHRSPALHVLDSTDPAQISAIEDSIDLARTLFIVSSKSGSTLEPNIFMQYFFDRVQHQHGKEAAARQFIAITDPGSKLQKVAERDRFRHVFLGVPSIGGRYSALSNFGTVPMAIAGLDLARFLRNADQMVQACRPGAPARENPGVLLGAILGTLAKPGRDKITIFASPSIFDLGAWLEQLLAESTGKNSKGLIPVDREPIGTPDTYASDRVFIYLRLGSAPNKEQDEAIEKLERAGQPVVRMELADTYNLGQEYFRWEVATAVAGSIIGINPFDQPDVEASKVATRALTSEYEQHGSLPAEDAVFQDAGTRLFTDSANWQAVQGDSLEAVLRAHLRRLRPSDYFALLAYVAMNREHENMLQKIRNRVLAATRNATCLGFGPRFLHSTGQAYKGGPNTGVFLQITSEDARDLPVPGQKYTFGIVKAAQARGDFAVLLERKRRALRIHLPADVAGGLQRLDSAIASALKH